MVTDDDSLTPDQRATLQRTRSLARFLDRSTTIPGTQIRLGADAILGIVPVIGDSLSGLLSLYIVVEAIRADVSRTTAARMLLNIALDSIGGSLPIVGTMFDIVWKANERNVSLLERQLCEHDGNPR